MASAKKSDGLEALSRFESAPQRNARVLGVAVHLLEFIGRFTKEVGQTWFHLKAKGRAYPNEARVNREGFTQVMRGLVRMGWIEVQRDRRTKIPIARFVVPYAILLEWHRFTPYVYTEEDSADKKAKKRGKERQVHESHLKDSFTAWLEVKTSLTLIAPELRDQHAARLEEALETKASSSEVRQAKTVRPTGVVNRQPATSGKEEAEMAKPIGYEEMKVWGATESNVVELLRQMVRRGAGRKPGVLSSVLMAELITWLGTQGLEVDASAIGNWFRFGGPLEKGYVSGSGKTSSKRWCVDVAGHALVRQRSVQATVQADTDAKKAEAEAEAQAQAEADLRASAEAEAAAARATEVTIPALLEAVEDPTDDEDSGAGVEVHPAGGSCTDTDIVRVLNMLRGIDLKGLSDSALKHLSQSASALLLESTEEFSRRADVAFEQGFDVGKLEGEKEGLQRMARVISEAVAQAGANESD